MQKLCGRYTNDTTDLGCEMLRVFHIYENGDAKVRYALYYKKDFSVIEIKTAKLKKYFFDINTKVL